jgi:hypothetical protein
MSDTNHNPKIKKSKTILANVDGFTPVIDSVVDNLGIMPAVVFGRVWRYCQMEDGVCKASLETIAEHLNITSRSVQTHIKALCKNGYLKDLTPKLRNRPHIYADTGKAGLAIQLSAKTGMKNFPTGYENFSDPGKKNFPLKKVFKKESKREGGAAAPAPENSSFSENPFLNAIKDATGYFPPKSTWGEIIKRVEENNVTLEALCTAAKEWMLSGYNPKSVRGILDWAEKGIPQRGGVPATSNPAPAIDTTAVEETRKVIEEKTSGNFVPRPAHIQRPRIGKAEYSERE